MKSENPFDTAITVRKGIPVFTREAAIELTDTLDLCWDAVRAVFEDAATPDHALAMLPQLMARADAKRQQVSDDYRRGTGDESEPT